MYSPALTDFVVMARGTSSMFLTGPDVVAAVTGEQVTIEELGGPDVHDARSGVAHLVADSERQALELVKQLLGYLPQNNNEDPPQVIPYDPADRMDDALNTLIPEDEAEAYDVREILDRRLRPGQLPRDPPGLRAQRGRRLRAARRLLRRHRRQPAVGDGGRPRHRRVRQDHPLHPDLRRLQHPGRHLRGLPGVPARDGPGVPGRHPPRRQDHLRLLRGHRPQDLDRDPQGDGRRLRRHELAPDAHGRRVRLAGGADRRHGRRGRRADPVPARDRRGRGSRGRRGGLRGRVPGRVLQPVPGRGRRARSTRSSSRARRASA